MKIKIQSILLSLIPATTLAAGFDCTKSTTKIEITICESKLLSELDVDLNRKFISNIKSTTDQEIIKKIKKSQSQWIKKRNECLDTTCLETEYRMRITELDSHINDGKEQIESVNPGTKYIELNNPSDKIGSTAPEKIGSKRSDDKVIMKSEIVDPSQKNQHRNYWLATTVAIFFIIYFISLFQWSKNYNNKNTGMVARVLSTVLIVSAPLTAWLSDAFIAYIICYISLPSLFVLALSRKNLSTWVIKKWDPNSDMAYIENHHTEAAKFAFYIMLMLPLFLFAWGNEKQSSYKSNDSDSIKNSILEWKEGNPITATALFNIMINAWLAKTGSNITDSTRRELLAAFHLLNTEDINYIYKLVVENKIIAFFVISNLIKNMKEKSDTSQKVTANNVLQVVAAVKFLRS